MDGTEDGTSNQPQTRCTHRRIGRHHSRSHPQSSHFGIHTRIIHSTVQQQQHTLHSLCLISSGCPRPTRRCVRMLDCRIGAPTTVAISAIRTTPNKQFFARRENLNHTQFRIFTSHSLRHKHTILLSHWRARWCAEMNGGHSKGIMTTQLRCGEGDWSR